MRFALVATLLVAAIPMAFGACGGDDDDDGGGTTTPSNTTTTGTTGGSTTTTGAGGGPTGRCAQAVAAQPCAPDCAYDPTTLDCATACQHIADICSSGCTDQCTGLTQDVALCTVGCDGVKTLNCTNLVYGCFEHNTTCDDVGNCVAAEM